MLEFRVKGSALRNRVPVGSSANQGVPDLPFRVYIGTHAV